MQIDLSKYKCAVFDCDGVILDSNQLKIDAFRSVLVGEPVDLIEAFIDYHRSTGGVSRYYKFKTFYADMKIVPDADAQAEAAILRYGEEVRKRLFSCPKIPGVERFLSLLNEAEIPCAVNSGGDQNEILDVFEERDLASYFRRTLGSPATKTENMTTLASENFLEMPGVLFGDASSDLAAAMKFGLDFIFVAGVSDWDGGAEICRDQGHQVIQTFEDFF